MISCRQFFVLFPLALLLFSCGGGAEVEQPAEPAPKLVSTDPANGATGLKGTTLSVVFKMDQNVKVTAVTVNLEGLEKGETYTVTIPAGAIEGFKTNQESAPEVSVTFTMVEGLWEALPGRHHIRT